MAAWSCCCHIVPQACPLQLACLCTSRLLIRTDTVQAHAVRQLGILSEAHHVQSNVQKQQPCCLTLLGCLQQTAARLHKQAVQTSACVRSSFLLDVFFFFSALFSI